MRLQGQKGWIWLLWLLFTRGISQVNHFCFNWKSTALHERYLSISSSPHWKATWSLVPLCFFIVLCPFAYTVFQGNLNMHGKPKKNVLIRATNTPITTETLSKHRHCEFPCSRKTGILGLRGWNPQHSSFERQYLQQNTPKQDTKLLKWKIQSEGFPDCCFSVKISYNCWVPFQFHGISGISPFFQ